uniref:Uncharacterized protein n=1 Tax=Globodera rostochiensis TaxID=31243 RepID=A0A914HEW0_GLORO
MNSAKKAIPRPNGNRTESPSQKTAPTTARPMLQFAIPPGLAIPRQQQQLLQAMAGRAREGSIFHRPKSDRSIDSVRPSLSLLTDQ